MRNPYDDNYGDSDGSATPMRADGTDARVAPPVPVDPKAYDPKKLYGSNYLSQKDLFNSDLSIGGAYRDVVNDWYSTGLDANNNLTADYTFTPELIDANQFEQYNPYDFTDQRNRMRDDIASQGARNFQMGIDTMAASGGLTAADRMNMASQFNRQQMGTLSKAYGDINAMESSNAWETGNMNTQLANNAYLQNIDFNNKAQAANIGTLRDQRRFAGDLARDMYERDIKINRAEKLGVMGNEG